MLLKRQTDSFSKIILLVIGIVFGLSLLAMGYKAATSKEKTGEIRSKAGYEAPAVVKAWEFNGTTTEGWVSYRNTANLYISEGSLRFASLQAGQKILLTNTAFTIKGIKTLGIRLKVEPMTGSCPSYVQGSSPKPCVTPTPYNFPYQMKIKYYVKKDGKYYLYPDILTVNGTADGEFHDYSFDLKDKTRILPIHRVHIEIPTANIQSADIDFIRFSYVMPTPTPTISPTPTVTPSPTPPEGCSYQARCAARGDTNCPVELVCPRVVTGTPRTTPAANSTKTGTVVQDNLEGTSRYKLVVSNSEFYRLGITNTQEAERDRNQQTHAVTWDTIKSFVGKTATVTGYIQESTKGTPSGYIGVPTSSQPTIIVYTIR